MKPSMIPLLIARGLILALAGGRAYLAHLAVPSSPGKHSAIVLIHSFSCLEQGYKDMADAMATDGFVVIAPEWQIYNQRAGDRR